MIYYLGLVGIAAFAITGVIAAGKKGMDIFSIILLGVATALGGGTLRDIILDTNPVFWIGDISYLWVSIVAAVIAFFAVRLVSYFYKIFLYVDAFGLALFTVLATEKTVNLGFSAPIAVFMGVITGVAGGMIRDVLTDKMPLVLGKEFYATPALIGAIMFIVLSFFTPGSHDVNRFCAIGLIVFLRLLSIHLGLYYPGWLTYKNQKDRDRQG